MNFLQYKFYKVNHSVEGLYNRVFIGRRKLSYRKELENGVGFLVHLSRTFPDLFP